MAGSSSQRYGGSRMVGALGALIASCAALLLIAAPAAAEPGPPLPGGNYVGETSKGKALKVKVESTSLDSVLRGRVIQPCSGMKARFKSEDGSFVAKRTNKRGKVVFKATGEFEAMQEANGEVKRLRKAKRRGRCKPAPFGAELANSAPIMEKTVSYGPFDTEPSGGHGHGGGGGHNVPLANLEKPCEDCYLVGALPNLTHPDGSTANFDTEAMLHHVVFSSQGTPDTTCTNRSERFFASGNERAPMLIPRGYGYRVEPADSWRLITHIMNMGHHARDLFIEVTYYYVDASADVKDVKPFWLDIDLCGNSEYMTPAGPHTAVRDFKVTGAWAGKVVAVGGHLHDYGETIKLTNPSRGEVICEATGDYDQKPSYMGHIERVGGCSGAPLATVAVGETVRLLSHYDAPEPIHDVMGIMFGFVDPS